MPATASCRRQRLQDPSARGLAGPGLLPMCWCRNMPTMFRSTDSRRSTRAKASTSTARPWPAGSGATSELLTPLVEAVRGHVMAATKLHADDTPVPVLAPGNGRTKTGRLWTYVRDDRASGDPTAPAVWFAYSPDRRGENPRQHLKLYQGALQADAYASFQQLCEAGTIVEVACWAHPLARSTSPTLRRL